MKQPASIGFAPELLERLKKEAFRVKRSRSSLVELLVEEGLERLARQNMNLDSLCKEGGK